MFGLVWRSLHPELMSSRCQDCLSSLFPALTLTPTKSSGIHSLSLTQLYGHLNGIHGLKFRNWPEVEIQDHRLAKVLLISQIKTEKKSIFSLIEKMYLNSECFILASLPHLVDFYKS